MGNISGDCSECCCHLSAAHTVTLPKARGIFLQHRQEKRFERPGRAAGREGCGEGQELKVLAKRRNSDIRSCPKATSRSCELTASRADEGDNLGLVGFFLPIHVSFCPQEQEPGPSWDVLRKACLGSWNIPLGCSCCPSHLFFSELMHSLCQERELGEGGMDSGVSP